MSELIDRDALLQDMTHRGGLGIEHWHVFDVINEQPSIDAQPIKHGKWETINPLYSNVYCSECGAAVDKYLAKRYKGCPFCLCIMEGGTDNA